MIDCKKCGLFKVCFPYTYDYRNTPKDCTLGEEVIKKESKGVKK